MRKYGIWIILIILVLARILFFYQTRPSYPDGTKIRITEKVTSEPIRYSSSTYLKLSGYKIYIPLYPEVNYGDAVVVEGVVDKDSLKEVKLVRVDQSKGVLYKLRRRLLEVYHRSLPDPHAALVAGVTLGSKESIPKEFWESLKATGTAHVIVASGMNVTLVAKFLMGFLIIFLPRRRAIPLALAGVWAYSILSGFDAPIVRAAVMGSLAFTAEELGRINAGIRTLAITGFTMLIIWPGMLTDLGFWLSFLATGSIILFEKRIRGYLKFVPKILRDDLSTTLSAQIGVAPLLFISFGQFNLLSPLINAAVLWTVPLITVIGIVAGIAGLVVEPLGRLLLLLAYPLTSWFIFVVQLFG